MKDLEDTAEDVCALTLAAWNSPAVKETARLLSYDQQALFRGLLATQVAGERLAQQSSLRDRLRLIGECE